MHVDRNGQSGTRLVFLGTGASGGTPGRGRSRRQESSLLVEDGDVALLLDVTRDFEEQAPALDEVDAVLLTHAHRDASGGLPALRRWNSEGTLIPVLANAHAIRILRQRYARLDGYRFVPTPAARVRRVGHVRVDAVMVPHSRDPRFPTYAWRIRCGRATIVYASDVARLTPALCRFCERATVLVVDGATWRRTIFSHLRIDRDLPELCDWHVHHIFLTQIGRSAPPHRQLTREVGRLCARARPAYDGLVVTVGGAGASRG